MTIADVDSLSATLFALADPTRRGILARLTHGSASVKELAAPYAMSFAAVSKHIKVLEQAGLVSRGKDAQFRPCHLETKPLRAVAVWVEDYRRFWERSADRLEDYLAELQRTERGGRGATRPEGTRAAVPRKSSPTTRETPRRTGRRERKPR